MYVCDIFSVCNYVYVCDVFSDSLATEFRGFSVDPPTEGTRRHTPVAQDGGENSGVHWAEFLSRLNQSSISVSRRMEDGFQLKCGYNREVCWRPMVTTHWRRLLNYTGYSTDGKYVCMYRILYTGSRTSLCCNVSVLKLKF